MRKMGIGVVVALGLVMGLMFAASELGGEVVRLVTRDTDGTLHETSLWVVEDEGAFARVLCDALELDGHTTEWAEDGHDALLRLRAREFDLIVSDLRMPGMNGEELRREIERLDVAMLDRLIWTTGDTAPGQRRLGAEFERTLLHKPFDLEELRELVRHRLAADDRAR